MSNGPTTHLVLGLDGLLYVAELWWRKGVKTPKGEEIASDRYGRISLLNNDGRAVARYGGGVPNTPGNFTAPHGIAVDNTNGRLYVTQNQPGNDGTKQRVICYDLRGEAGK